MVLDTTGLVDMGLSAFNSLPSALVDLACCVIGGLVTPSKLLFSPPGTVGVTGRSFSLSCAKLASLWLEEGRWLDAGRWLDVGRCEDSVPLRLSLVGDGGEKTSPLVGAAKLLRLLANESPRMRPEGS